MHRGNLKNMTENMRNNMVVGGGKNKTTCSGDDRNGNKTTTTTTTTASSERIIKQEFVPIKGRVRQLEDDSSKQAKNEDNFKKASHKNGKSDIDDKVEVDNGNDPQQTSDDSNEDSNKLEQQEETKFNVSPPTVAVPTPLPRTSRNNSMTDPSSSEESTTGSPRPSPMPRVTIGSGYKVLNNNDSFPSFAGFVFFCFFSPDC